MVLIDDTGVRAIMTASWLIQMGWEEVYVLEDGLENNDLKKGPEQKKVLGIEEVNPENLIFVEQLNQIIKNENPLILDLADSLEFREGHLPGAKRASRSGMAKYLENQNLHSHVILSSSDGALASLTAEEVQINLNREVLVLEGGVEAWKNAGYLLEQGDDPDAGELSDDVWYKPYQRADAVEDSMKAYLSWEVGLVEQIERDGTTNFKPFDPSVRK